MDDLNTKDAQSDSSAANGTPLGHFYRVVWRVIGVMGLAFPMVGISLILILSFDYLVLSRIPRLKQRFS
ncbi:MAG TPA: hypothetical protein VFS27_13010 [Blastocatellia bacterium]|nr:hypothetical protein [Blastocatellia bacterium]